MGLGTRLVFRNILRCALNGTELITSYPDTFSDNLCYECHSVCTSSSTILWLCLWCVTVLYIYGDGDEKALKGINPFECAIAS